MSGIADLTEQIYPTLHAISLRLVGSNLRSQFYQRLGRVPVGLPRLLGVITMLLCRAKVLLEQGKAVLQPATDLVLNAFGPQPTTVRNVCINLHHPCSNELILKRLKSTELEELATDLFKNNKTSKKRCQSALDLTLARTFYFVKVHFYV